MATRQNVSQLITLSPLIGLGGEKLWLCPSLSKNGDTQLATDLSGNRNHGTYNGNLKTVADNEKGGSRCYLSGVNGTDTITGSLSGLSNKHPTTVSGWFTIPDNTANRFFSLKESANTWIILSQNSSLGAIIPSAGLNIQFAGAANASGTSGYPTDTWVHLVFVVKSNEVELFENGVSKQTRSHSLRSPVPTSFSVFETATGKADDFRVYDRALTLSEIKHLSKSRGIQGNGKTRLKARYNEPAGVFVPRTNFLAWYRKSWAISKPNYKTGYARNRQESAHPNLWDGLEVALCPSLGITGNELHHIGKLHGDGKADLTDTNWVAGNKGIALDFNGSSSTGQGPIDDLTVSAISIWFKPTQTIDKDTAFGSLIDLRGNSAAPNAELSAIAVGSGTADLTDEYIMILQRDFPAAGLRTGVADGGSLTAGVWYHLVCTCEPSGTFQIYLNGVEKSIVTSGGGCTPLTADVGTYRIGTLEDDTSLRRFFDGEIGTTLVYSRSLSPSEIKQLYIDSNAPFRIKTQVQAAPAPAPAAFKAFWAKIATRIAGILK